MRKSLIFASLALLIVLFSCGSKNATPQQQEKTHKELFEEDLANSKTPYARISAPKDIDMGVFDAEHLVKSVVMKVNNTGTDTLYINTLMPECDCTTLEISDSVVAPKSDTRITVTMDISEYTPGKIHKSFSIISNSVDNHVLHIGLDCERK